MPNHTDNRVILSHPDSKKIDDIYNVMNTEDTPLCQTLIPMPEDTEDWYSWCVKNWGTKWDIYEGKCDRMDANTLVMTFYTAWSPPIPVFNELVRRGFDIDARYLDEGWLFIGQFYAQDGKVDDFCKSDIKEAIKQLPELGETFWHMEEWDDDDRDTAVLETQDDTKINQRDDTQPSC